MRLWFIPLVRLPVVYGAPKLWPTYEPIRLNGNNVPISVLTTFQVDANRVDPGVHEAPRSIPFFFLSEQTDFQEFTVQTESTLRNGQKYLISQKWWFDKNNKKKNQTHFIVGKYSSLNNILFKQRKNSMDSLM